MSEPPAAPDLLRQFLGDRDVPCPRCGYNLRGLTTNICPECSGPVELALRGDVPLGRHRRLVLLATGLGAGGFALSAIVSLFNTLRYLLSTGTPVPPWRYWVSAGLYVGVDVTIAIILARAFRGIRRTHHQPGLAGDALRRAMAMCALAVALYAACLVLTLVLRLFLV